MTAKPLGEMARRQEERVPLLSDEELPEDDLGGIQVSISRARDGRRAPHGRSFPSTSAGVTSGGLGLSGGEEGEEGQTVGRRRKHYSGNEMIVSVFVVQFNIRKGEQVSLHPLLLYTPLDPSIHACMYSCHHSVRCLSSLHKSA